MIGNGSWNREMVDDLFFPHDVVLILGRKPIIDQEDYWVWNDNKGGEYTVKSDHWLANKEKNALLIHEMSALPSINVMKEEIWALKAPSKLKNLMWRAITEAIPVADQIRARGMKCDSRCQMCGQEGESVNHLLFNCPAARQVWPFHKFHGQNQVLKTIQSTLTFATY